MQILLPTPLYTFESSTSNYLLLPCAKIPFLLRLCCARRSSVGDLYANHACITAASSGKWLTRRWSGLVVFCSSPWWWCYHPFLVRTVPVCLREPTKAYLMRWTYGKRTPRKRANSFHLDWLSSWQPDTKAENFVRFTVPVSAWNGDPPIWGPQSPYS